MRLSFLPVLLFWIVGLGAFACGRAPTHEPSPGAAESGDGPPHFVDTTAESGLEFEH